MQNITITEWLARLEAIRDALARRWPWVTLTTNRGDLRLDVEIGGGSGSPSGAMRVTFGDGFLVPDARPCPSLTLGNNLSDAARALSEGALVVEILNVARSMAGDLRIYTDDRCPCSHCRGDGTIKRGSGKHSYTETCPTCNGTKIQPQPAQAVETTEPAP